MPNILEQVNDKWRVVLTVAVVGTVAGLLMLITGAAMDWTYCPDCTIPDWLVGGGLALFVGFGIIFGGLGVIGVSVYRWATGDD